MQKLISLCQEASVHLARNPLEGSLVQRLKKDQHLRDLSKTIEPHLHVASQVYVPAKPHSSQSHGTLKAVTWNIDRGKRFEAIRQTLKTHPDLNDADLYFLTEVDWGMARSENRNVAAELAESLGLYAYFAPSYYNFTNGHGNERLTKGRNTLGLHGKAILSRQPLTDLTTAPMTNTRDVYTTKEARLGQKRSLIASLKNGGHRLNLACIHLDAFSSPRMRANQFREAIAPLISTSGGRNGGSTLVAGDLNTNTINSSSGRTILSSVARQLAVTGPRNMILEHHPYPERKYDRPLFQGLSHLGFDYESLNEIGVGTYDLVNNDTDLGDMAGDQVPLWILKWIDRQVERSGGRISLKLDWFAGRNVTALDKEVIRLTPGKDGKRPSDHYPASVRFSLS